jgi:hypothetical protein
VVDEVSLTVNFSAVGLDTVKLEADTPVTVPTDPPAAFVDRALDPPLDLGELVEVLVCVVVVDEVVVDEVVAAAELDVPPHAASATPSAGAHSATPTPRMRLPNGRRRGLARPDCC